jgi:nucleoid-associated protein YgaU
MGGGTTRLGAGLTLLVLIWVLVYWWYEPSAPRVTFAAPPETDPAQAASAEPSEPVPDPPPPRATVVESAVVEPRFELYTIRPGDTAGSISRKFFGTPDHADAIARANPLMDIDRLRPGRTIRVPLDPQNIQGRLVRVERVVEPEPRPAEPVPSAPPPPAAGETEYTVRAGDSLSLISRRFYGSERYVDLIYNANRDRLRSRDQLRVGQVLRIPPRPATADGG